MEAVVDEEGGTAVIEYKINNEKGKRKKNSKRKLTIVMGWWLNVKKVEHDFEATINKVT